MVKPNQKTIGFVLAGISIILIFILIFVKNDIDRQGAFLCEITRLDPNLDMEKCPAHESNTSWLILAIFGLAFLILGSSIYMIFMPVKKEEHVFKEIDVSNLDDEERNIYRLLKEKGGSAYQSDLIRDTSFSKVKITRILDKMESKKLIERQRRGMTNIVVLK